MTANFFQSLTDRGVEYLLISGQATVLYGAATFSEDIDLWINPTAENAARFASALRDCGACYYKLTPPLSRERLVAGHGFHFVLPQNPGAEVFLDVMGAPPRVGTFASSRDSVQLMDTDWGRIPTVGLKDLVEIKKTQRLEDYPIISRLALMWLGRPECAGSPADFHWAVENIYTLDSLAALFKEHPEALMAFPDDDTRPACQFGRRLVKTGEVTEELEREVAFGMQQKMNSLQEQDRRYWRQFITELKQWRTQGELMAEGAQV